MVVQILGCHRHGYHLKPTGGQKKIHYKEFYNVHVAKEIENRLTDMKNTRSQTQNERAWSWKFCLPLH